MVRLRTHCRGQTSEREEKRNRPGTGENREPKQRKNSTIEASKLLKTRNGSGNEAKKYMEIKELYENTGSEAYKLLQTHDITLSKSITYAFLSCKLAQIALARVQKQHNLANESKLSSRLHEI